MTAGYPADGQGRDRLLVVTHSADLYGADRALLAALPDLAERFDVTIALPGDGPLIDRLAALPVRVLDSLPDYALRRRHLRPAGAVRWSWALRRAVASLSREHRRHPFDAIYSNSLASVLGCGLAVRWRVPHVLHVHEAPRDRLSPQRLPVLAARSTVDHVIFNSHYARWLITEREPRLGAASDVVHIGFDLPPRRREPAPSERLRVVCVGRIHPKKGHAVLIEAARRARQRGADPAWDVHVYGSALPEHRELEAGLRRQVEQAGLAGQVSWHGFCDDPAEMFTDADVAVVPSVVPEEYSLVCLEAQHFGVPVVATGPGGPSEIMAPGRSGLIVRPGDPDALAVAIDELGRDAERRRAFGRAGAERVSQAFRRDEYGRRVAEICQAVARRRPVPAPADRQPIADRP